MGYNSKDIVGITEYISKCYNKLSDIASHMREDDVRPDVKRDLKAWSDHWEDELWRAIEDKSRLEESMRKENGLENSNNN